MGPKTSQGRRMAGALLRQFPALSKKGVRRRRCLFILSTVIS